MALRVLLGVWMSLVIILGMSLPMVPHPEAWYELPIIPGLEDKARIIFFHVPTAWLSVLAFVSSMVYGIRYLWKKDLHDI